MMSLGSNFLGFHCQYFGDKDAAKNTLFKLRTDLPAYNSQKSNTETKDTQLTPLMLRLTAIPNAIHCQYNVIKKIRTAA